jgi:hypothetical protein
MYLHESRRVASISIAKPVCLIFAALRSVTRRHTPGETQS